MASQSRHRNGERTEEEEEEEGGLGRGWADKVPHLSPIKNKEAQTFICGQAFIGSFKSTEITESKMLIKWRQEMGSMGLLLSCFNQDWRSHRPPAPPLLPLSPFCWHTETTTLPRQTLVQGLETTSPLHKAEMWHVHRQTETDGRRRRYENMKAGFNPGVSDPGGGVHAGRCDFNWAKK